MCRVNGGETLIMYLYNHTVVGGPKFSPNLYFDKSVYLSIYIHRIVKSPLIIDTEVNVNG